MAEPWRGIGIINRGPEEQEIIFDTWEHSTGSGSNPSGTLHWPEAPVAGDVALAFLCKSNTTVGPNFHSDFGAVSYAGIATDVYVRECDGTEDLGGYTITIGGSAQWVAIIIIIRGLSGHVAVGSASHNEGGTGNIIYPTITPSDTPSIVFMVANGERSATGTPATPGGTNPTMTLLDDSNTNRPPLITNIVRGFIFQGNCVGTSATGDRTVAADGLNPTGNNYSITYAIKDA